MSYMRYGDGSNSILYLTVLSPNKVKRQIWNRNVKRPVEKGVIYTHTNGNPFKRLKRE